MSKLEDRKRIVNQITIAAELYKKNLVGKQFLYIFDGRFIEVMYKTENFKHLTGVDTYLSAKQFYKYAVNKILTINQIKFNSIHPYDLCQRKLKHICNIASLATSECFMLEDLTTNTQMYKFGTTDLNFTLCFGNDIDQNGNIKGNCYIAKSLRDGDCFSKSNCAHIVTHILSKQNDKVLYSNVLYIDKTASLNAIPPDIAQMVEPSLLKKEI